MCDELKKLQDSGGSIRRIIKSIGKEENIQGRKGNGKGVEVMGWNNVEWF